jgi:hypothetical protein
MNTQAWTIAKALFGWRVATEEERIAMNGPWPNGIKAATWQDGQMWVGAEPLPDFVDEVKQHYWIHRMEDRLAEMGLLEDYMVALRNWSDFTPHQLRELALMNSTRGYVYYRTTTAQRLAAAVRVVEGAGL